MAFETVQIQSLRNGVGNVVGYREDLVAGDVLTFSLTTTIGISGVQWQLVGRPEGSTAGGVGPEPINLGTSRTASFTVDGDSGFRKDGGYEVWATINPGSPGSVTKTVLVVRTSGISAPGSRLLRKLAAFESLFDDTSIVQRLQGWATQLNRWLDYLITVGSGGGGGSSAHTYPVEPMEDSSGGEVAQVQTQLVINFADFGSTVGLAVQGTGSSASGTAFVRVYVGGSDDLLDGTDVLTIPVSAGTAIVDGSASFPNPGGFKRVIFSIESSAASEDAQYRDVTMGLT